MNISTMSVNDIRLKLIESYGYTEDDVSSIKGKTNLSLVLKREIDAESGNSGFFTEIPIEKTEVKNMVSEENKQKPKAIEIGSKEWEDYVFSLLSPSELEEKDGVKYPKASGLRRLVQKLIGPIIKSGPIQVLQSSDESAMVVYELSVLCSSLDMYSSNKYIDIREDELLSNQVKVYSAAANVFRGNTPDLFALHAVATAETRAEGRALKRALSLSTYTAEEMSNDKNPSEFFENKIKISENKIKMNQITAITALCGRLKIDVHKFTGHIFPEHLVFDDNLSYEKASKLMVMLNKYQSKDSTSLEIPDSIKL